jgi:flagellar biosynthesis/type III secretory pathway M-ring protein FliF/YscJ
MLKLVAALALITFVAIFIRQAMKRAERRRRREARQQRLELQQQIWDETMGGAEGAPNGRQSTSPEMPG